jgi:hypothetical protein
MELSYSSSTIQPVDSRGQALVEASPAPQETLRLNRPSVRTGLLLVLTAAYLLPLTQVLYPVGDDGTILYGAQRVSEGAIPGRDFVEVMGPGSFYWLGLFFKLFGAGWQVSRMHLLFTGMATAGLLYAVARQVCRESVAVLLWLFVLVVGMPLWPVPSHHWDSNLFTILALWCYLKLEKTENNAWAAAAGSLAGITTCFMQQKGFLLLLGFAASAVLRRLWSRSYSPFIKSLGTPPSTPGEQVSWSGLWFIFGGYAAVAIGVLGAYWQAGALRDLLYANVIWPLSGYHDVNVVPYGQGLMSAAVNPSLHAVSVNWAILGFICAGLSFVPFLIIAILPLLSAGPVLASLFFMDKRTRWSPCLAVTLAGAGLWLSEIHRRDVVHLASGSPLLLIALLGSTQMISKIWLRRILMATVAAGLVIFGALNFLQHLRGAHTIETPRGTVMSVVDDQVLRFLRTSVRQREFVFVYPYCPIYYYLADVRNPTRFSLLMYDYNTPAQFDEVIHDLSEKRVRYVLDTVSYANDARRWFPSYREPAGDKRKLEQYLQKQYEEIAIIGGFRVLRRRPGL